MMTHAILLLILYKFNSVERLMPAYSVKHNTILEEIVKIIRGRLNVYRPCKSVNFGKYIYIYIYPLLHFEREIDRIAFVQEF